MVSIAIVKNTESGKAVIFVDDDGNIFVTSRVFLQGLLDGLAPKGFVLLKKLSGSDGSSSSLFSRTRVPPPPVSHSPLGSPVVPSSRVVPVVPSSGVIPSPSLKPSESTPLSDEDRSFYSKDIVIGD